MSKLEGGIFSRPRGKTGGIVFGAARTRRGKQVTTRLLVPPSNPNTAAQQAQRNKFKLSLQLAKALGPDVYREPLNRTVSQLAGFQALMSLLIPTVDTNTFRPPVNMETLLRGSNPNVQGLAFQYVDPDNELTWDPTPQSGGAGTDEVYVAAFGGDSFDNQIASAKLYTGQTVADGATGYTISPAGSETTTGMFIWTVGTGANAGIYSNIIWTSALPL